MDVTVTMQHMRLARFCSSGVRQFFLRHGFDYSKFLKEGISANKLAATGDTMIMKAVRIARG